MNALTHLDLFSGIGGFALGLGRTGGFRTVAFCEQNDFCQRVLGKHWPGVPIHPDIRELTGDAVGPVDIITGGFPCQPWSVAGQQRGVEDDRDLWPEMARLVSECRPRWVLGENVPGLIAHPLGLDRVLSDLEGLGYACRTFSIPACAVNSPHRRERVWIVAHARGGRLRGGESGAAEGTSRTDGGEIRQQRLRADTGEVGGTVGYTLGAGLEEWQGQPGNAGPERQAVERASDGTVGHADEPEQGNGQLQRGGQQRGFGGDPQGHWDDAEWICGGDGKWRRTQPGIRLLAHGISGRVARLRALGNAVVPQCVEAIGRAIIETEGMKE